VDRREQIRRLLQIGDCKPEEQIFARNAAPRQGANVLIVCGALGDSMVEDSRVRREPGDRQRVDVRLSVPDVSRSRVMLSSHRL
jgi:hypothetical protein